jgi:hypothetical protein
MGDARVLQALRPLPGVTASVHADGIVLVHPRAGRLFAANRTGARIWYYVEQDLPAEVISSRLSRDYQIDDQTAREHTSRFLAVLQHHGLLAPDEGR